jgi:hypothetical protein
MQTAEETVLDLSGKTALFAPPALLHVHRAG